MKRLIFAVLLISMMVGCNRSNEGEKQTRRIMRHSLVVEIDGCEYFKCHTQAGYYTLCHKGNCNNPIHSEHLRK